MKATIQHGEGASVLYLVDETKPEGEQPAVVASFKIGAMKLADLKRIPVGTRFRQVASLMGPCDNARVVAAVHTNAIEFTGDGIKPGPDGKPRTSWLYFPKASLFAPEGDGARPGFTIYEIDDYTKPDEPPKKIIAARYVFATD